MHFEDESFVGLLLLLPWPVVVSVLENFGFGSPVVVVVCVQLTFPFVRSNVPPDVSQSCWLGDAANAETAVIDNAATIKAATVSIIMMRFISDLLLLHSPNALKHKLRWVE